MTARWMTRCRKCGTEDESPQRFALVECDAEDCSATATDEFGFCAGGQIRVPPGWLQVQLERRHRDEGSSYASMHFCPDHAHTAVKIARKHMPR